MKKVHIKPLHYRVWVLRYYNDQIKLRLQVNLMLVGSPNDKASKENRARGG